MNEGKIVKTKNKGECIQCVGSDLEGINRMIVSTLQRTGGRPATYENSKSGLEEFRNKTIEFFNYIMEINKENELEKGVIPDVELFCSYMSITRVTLASYRKRGGEWTETIDYIKNMIAAYKKQMGLTYKIPPMVMAFDFCNNHDYKNTSEFKITAEASAPEDEKRFNLEKEIENSGLVWDEEKQDFVEKRE